MSCECFSSCGMPKVCSISSFKGFEVLAFLAFSGSGLSERVVRGLVQSSSDTWISRLGSEELE